MSWRAMLVHVKLYESWSEHLDVALRLAARFGAHLTGLCTLRDAALLRTFVGDRAAGAARRIEEDYALAAQLEARFLERLAAAGVAGRWETAEGNAGECLALAGRCQDLVVTEAHCAARDEPGFEAAEYAVLGSRAPTLMVPATGAFPEVGRRVLIAWNAGREAAAAVRGALPLLTRSERCLVLAGRQREDFAGVTRAPSQDLPAYLRLHGVQAECRAFAPADSEAGEAILEAAAGWGADLVVMGAYGRSRFTRWMLGGATSQVLHGATVPVLMAH